MLSKRSWYVSAYIALLLFAFVKFFVADIVRVGADDMRASYKTGDALLFTRHFNSYAAGDVIYFGFPTPDSSLLHNKLLQRIAGMPGDTLEIRDKQVFVNSQLIQENENIQFNYFIKSKCALDSLYMLQLGLTEGGVVSDEHDYSFSLTDSQMVQLKRSPDIEKVEMRTEKKGDYDESCFPFKSTYAWNNYYYGKIYIPKENDTLRIDTANLVLYQTLIALHEKNKLEVRADSIFINDVYTHTYAVKKNYYFVLGDNRANANDSRNWGYLPENLIYGKIQWRIRAKK